ncbi:MAG: hypothetical protein ACOY4K_00535 [Pseudomonadota bacterium]
MKARFLGSGDPEETGCQVFGQWFPLGEWVEVASAKLATNPCFEFDADADEEADPSVEDMKAELDRRGVKYHHKAGPAKLKALLDGDL